MERKRKVKNYVRRWKSRIVLNGGLLEMEMRVKKFFIENEMNVGIGQLLW